MKMKTLHNPHWAAYLAASSQSLGTRRPQHRNARQAGRVARHDTVPRCRLCEAVFFGFAGTAAVVIGWLLLFGWR